MNGHPHVSPQGTTLVTNMTDYALHVTKYQKPQSTF